MAAAVLTFTLWGQVPGLALVSWFACYALACTWGEVLAGRFLRSPIPENEALVWGRLFTANAFVGGLLWASTPLILFPQGSMVHQALLAFVIGGVSVGMVMSHCAYREAHLPFILIVFLTLIVRFWYEHDSMHLTMGLLLAVFLVYLVAAAGRMRRSLIRSLELRFENRELVENLRDERNAMAALNEKLVSEISDHAKAAAALRESEEKFRLISEQSLMGIAIIQDDRFQYLNKATKDLSGYDPEELMKCETSELIERLHPADRDSVVDEARKKQAGKSKEASSYCFRIYTPAGDVKWLQLYSRSIEFRSRPADLVSFIDLTERVLFEQALKESEEKYRLLVENANDGIILLQDCEIRFANPKVKEFFQGVEGLPTLKGVLESVHPEDREALLRRYSRRVRGEPLQSRHLFRVVDKKGDLRWIESNAAAATWDGEPAFFYFLSDVTARLQMEDERLKAQKLETIGILAGGIAHDFNNILTAIHGNISMAKTDVTSEDAVRDRLEKAESACLRAESLTRQLLTFARGSSHTKKLCSVANAVREACRFALRGSNSALELSVPEDLWSAEADEGQINQVVHNLIINADQAMGHGGVVHVSAKNLSVNRAMGLPVESGPYLRIDVHDSGLGIPEEDIPRIFDPYFTTKPKGTGLGLASSYSIIRNHRGVITVESEINVGTTLRVYLPACPGEVPQPRETGQRLRKSDGRVLLMDDERDVREVAGKMLSHLGFKVTLAQDGDQALNLYKHAMSRSEPYDAVILDLTIPGGMGGRQAIVKLREVDPAVRAIVASGFSTNSILSDFQAHGFLGAITKPFTLQSMSQTLTQVLAGPGRRAGSL